MPKLSVSMIVRNEESCLATALKSVSGADELIVVDTGSTDATKAIAESFGAKIYDFEWDDDFSAARNFALSKCTGSWVLSIDADEELAEGGIEKIRKEISACPSTWKTLSVRMISKSGGHEHPLQRVLRRTPDLMWVGAAHELPNVVEKHLTDIVIFYGYSDAHKQDPQRMMRILTKALKKNPNSSRDRYYLAREYWYLRDYERADQEYQTYLRKATWAPEMADAWLMRARCLWNMQRGEKARDACLQAIKINANFKEACLFMAEMCWPKNKARWNAIAETASNEDVLFVRTAPVASKAPPLDLDEPSLKYFRSLLLGKSHIDVLEWGAGNSTRYFTDLLRERGISFTWDAMEHDKSWSDRVRGLKDVNIILADKDSDAYLTPPKPRYNLIYIDGRNRAKCLRKAKTLLAPGGMVLLHDAQREYYAKGFEGYNYKLIGGPVKLWHGRLDEWPRIPRIIHQIWIGKKPRPVEWMNTWRDLHPNWEHNFWDESRIDALDLKNRALYDEYYNEGCFNGAANVARAEILLRYGGVYIDADSKCLTSLEGAPFMDEDFFSVYEADNFYVDGLRLVANGIIGAAPGHRYLEELTSRLGKVTERSPSWRKSGPLLWTGIVGDSDQILPPYTFLPVHHSGFKNHIDGVVYAEQFWSTTQEIKNSSK